MITQVRRLRIRPTIKNPLSDKLKEKQKNFLSRKYVCKTVKKLQNSS